jgi:transglutaminase-like putative cysteine protease
MRRMRVDHVTEYRFSAAVTLLPHQLRLRPRSSHDVELVSTALEVTPEPHVRWQRDALDNSVALLTFSEATALLRIASSFEVDHHLEAPLDFVVEQYAVTHPFAYADDELLALWAFLSPTWPDDAEVVEGWLFGLELRGNAIETFVLLDRLNRYIHRAFRYEPREAPGVQSPALTIVRGTGSCRDFAALFMDACRGLGLASRFVSGYLYAPAVPWNQGATHAWAEVYLPGPGWTGFDPTTGTLSGADHIAVAVAHHPERVPPVAGEFVGPAGTSAALHVTVGVQVLQPT